MAWRPWQARHYVKQHRAATALALLVPALVASGLAVSAPSFADAGFHHVRANVQPEVNSIFYSTSSHLEEPITFCAALPQRTSAQWVDGGMDIANGKAVRMITFASPTCTDGYIKAFDLVGPKMDGDTNWWVTLQ
jgi:hypothetical protein